MQKLSSETFEIIVELLELEYNSCDDADRRKELEDALSEIDAISTY